MRAEELAHSLVDLYAGASKHIVGVDVVQTGDFGILVLHKRLPIERARGGTAPAVALGLGDLPRVAGGEHHELLWNTSHIDAGAADGGISRGAVLELSLEEGHLGAVAGGDARSKQWADPGDERA